MSNVIPFDFDGNAVRAIVREGEPWFVAKDVCDVLEIGNSRDALSRLDEDEKDVGNTDTLGGQQEMNIISESGLYSLIFRSRKPEAKRFRKWVTGEVLPSLRKYGCYGEAKPESMEPPEALALPPASLRVKPSLRVQALHSAVQVAKMQGGDEAEVDRLYEKYCSAFAARAKVPETEAHPSVTLVSDFVEEAMVVTDISLGTMPRDLKTQMKDIHALFASWCEEVRGMRDPDVPSMRVLGAALRQLPHIHRVSPINKSFWNLRPA